MKVLGGTKIHTIVESQTERVTAASSSVLQLIVIHVTVIKSSQCSVIGLHFKDEFLLNRIKGRSNLKPRFSPSSSLKIGHFQNSPLLTSMGQTSVFCVTANSELKKGCCQGEKNPN